MWECKCECGKSSVVYGYDLRKGKTKSCGCLRSEILTIHGMHKSRFYSVWSNMVSRCTNESYPFYENYGGRGIEICDRWRVFENFRDDMHASYLEHAKQYGEKDTTIERIDVNGNYVISNITWATMQEQSQNKRINKNNKSGHAGISWMESRKKWRARVTSYYKEHHIGMYDSLEEAVEAREEFIKQL